jgi:sulfate adenylyltransferase subunit 1
MTALTAKVDTKPPAAAQPPELDRANSHDLNGMLRILTCGSVDDGKSTLIGRLLWDATDLYDDQRETLEKSGRTAGGTDVPDFSLLVDGLLAEREQGITIDIAWRYVDTKTRRFVIIDSPGHEQYTRNMASGASHADLAIMLIDARHGIKRQTRRHAAILDLVGVKRVILAVNKMDLVDWSEEIFRKIETDFKELSQKFGFWEALTIPASAVGGDNIARKSENMPWYDGPILLDHLEELPSRGTAASGPFRMPVQTVLRDGKDFRGLAGTISSGTVRVGETVVDPVSRKSARVARIATMNGDLDEAHQHQAVAIQLDADIDVTRGAVLAHNDTPPTVARTIEARLVWLNEAAFDPRAGYLFRTATDLVPISNMEIKSLLELETLVSRPTSECGVNDIALASISLGRPTSIDAFADAQETGSFLIVDAITGASVAAGVVEAASNTASETASDVFVLTRAMLQRGLCTDLQGSGGGEAEFSRRANEVALILRAAGIKVEIESPPDYQI